MFLSLVFGSLKIQHQYFYIKENIQYTHAAADIILVLSSMPDPQITYKDYLLPHLQLTAKIQLIIITIYAINLRFQINSFS